jgi:DNA-binding transcriptional MerR regulator
MGRDDLRHGIDELAELGGVSRRTVRYYIQEGLLPPPLGVGRGRHYGKAHLDALLKVKALQEAGRTLDEIRDVLSGSSRRSPIPAVRTTILPRAVWRRYTLAPGVELHVAADVRPPTATGLEQLADWCRVHLAPGGRGEDDDAED